MENANVLENVDFNGNVQKKKVEYKTTVYLKGKSDFKFGQEREIVILKGHLNRQLFKGKTLACKSFNGITGKARANGEWGEEEDCSECGYAKGVKIQENGKEVELKCQLQYTIIFEHEDPDKEYSLSMNTESRINLDKYAKELLKQGLMVNQVVTGITRGESTRTVSTQVFSFRKIRDLSIELTDDEREKLNGIIGMTKVEGPISAVQVKEMLLKLPSLKGISEERAARLANLIADETGMVHEKCNFV